MKRASLQRVVWIALGLILAAAAIRYARPIASFLGDEARVQAWLDQLGPLGPLGVIALNALQVVIAFIPGYAMQIAAGFLYGFPLGALYGAIGMTLGGIIAMSLARLYGRPLVVRMIGHSRMARWEDVARLNSLPIWFFMMFGPFGDVPYYIAGLTRLPVWKVIVVAVLVRTPAVMVAAAVGAGLLDWRSPWIIAGTAVIMVIGALVVFNQARLECWIDEQILPRVARLGRK